MSFSENSLKIVSCRTNVTSNPSSGRFESKENKESNKRCLNPIRDSDPTSEIKSLAELDSTRIYFPNRLE